MEAYQKLEEQFAQWAGVENVVCCSSGTAALHLALEVLQLPPKSQVIVPTFTMIACARAVTLAGLEPVFMDCGEDLLMDIKLATHPQESANMSAIMAVHIYGRRCNLNWPTTAETHKRIKVVEDLAEAHGMKPHPSTDAACYSFYRNKIICGEEGGAVAFRNPQHAALARQLRSLGFTDGHDFTHIPRGHNYRMSNVHAELILDSLSRVETNIQQRRLIESWYDAACPDEWRMPKRDVVWVYDLRIPGLTSETQGKIVRLLNENGIQARHAFKPMHMQKEYRDCRRIGGNVAERMSREVIYLPVVPFCTSMMQIEESFRLIRSVVNYP